MSSSLKQRIGIQCLRPAPILNLIWRLNPHRHPFYVSPQAENAVQSINMYTCSLTVFLFCLFLETASSFIFVLVFFRLQFCIDLKHTRTHSHKFAQALFCCSEKGDTLTKHMFRVLFQLQSLSANQRIQDRENQIDRTD